MYGYRCTAYATMGVAGRTAPSIPRHHHHHFSVYHTQPGSSVIIPSQPPPIQLQCTTPHLVLPRSIWLDLEIFTVGQSLRDALAAVYTRSIHCLYTATQGNISITSFLLCISWDTTAQNDVETRIPSNHVLSTMNHAIALYRDRDTKQSQCSNSVSPGDVPCPWPDPPPFPNTHGKLSTMETMRVDPCHSQPVLIMTKKKGKKCHWSGLQGSTTKASSPATQLVPRGARQCYGVTCPV